MEQAKIVEEFIELVRIDAASRNERAVADALTAKLREMGFTVTEDDAGEQLEGNAGNLTAVLPGKLAGSLLFAAHIDRVQLGIGINPRMEGEKLVSGGDTILAADDLSGVAAILDGIRRVKESGKAHPRIEVLFTVCEEIGVKGSLHLDTSGLQSEFGYVLDSPGRIGRVLRSAMGKAQLFLDVKGKSAHAAYPEEGVSATRAAVTILAALGDGRIDEETVVNWSYLVAPGPCNAIPDAAEAKAFAMSRDDLKLQAYLDRFVAVAEETAARTGASVDARYIWDYPAFNVQPESRCVELVTEVLSEMGIQPVVEHGGGGLDANRLNGYGIECVGLSTGYGGNHTTKEYLYVEDLIQSGQMVEGLILAYSRKENR